MLELERLEELFSSSVSWDRVWRDEATIDYQYYNGAQWTQDEIDTLVDRGQATGVYNHIAPTIDAVIGGERQNRPDITMIGRTNDDERVAQVKTSLYSYIEYNSDTDDEIDLAVKDFLVVGRGWLYINPRLSGKEFDDIYHEYKDYRNMFSDPLNTRDDFKDARFVHEATFVDADVIEATFPTFKADEASDVVFGFEGSSEEHIWYDSQNRSRPRLITTWYRHANGDMELIIWVKGQILHQVTNPYSTREFPYVQMTYKRNLDNQPYGVVRAMRSAQDEVNKRHSKALHYLNSRQVLAEEDAFVDWNEAEKTLAKPDGITKLNDNALAEGRVQLVDNAQLAATHIQMMEHARSQITQLAGLNSAFMGQSSQYESAKKTNLALNQAQSTLVPMLNTIRKARHRLATITMQLVPDFYTDERIIRIVNPTNEYAFMPVNQVVLADDGTLVRMNDVTSDDVDVIIEDAPAGLNDRMEQFAQLLQIQGQTARPIPMEILLRYSSLKDKHQLAQELEQYYSMESQMQQLQQYIQQLESQMQQMGGQVNQVKSQLVQSETARAVDKEVNKAKEDISKEKQRIKDSL